MLTLQVQIDSAKNHPWMAHVLFVGQQGCVGRKQDHIMTLPHKRSRQSIVSEAIATDCSGCTGGDVGYAQSRLGSSIEQSTTSKPV